MAAKNGLSKGSEDTKPSPDPTVYTNEAIERAVAAERDYVDGKIAVLTERLEGIDEATKLARADIVKIPCQIKEATDSLKELLRVELKSVDDKFDATEKVRLEQKQDSKESLGAALTAAKEAVSEQNKSNTESIRKSEVGTSETIKANQESSKAITDQLTKDLDGLKLLVNSLVASKAGQTETVIEARSVRADTRGGLGNINTIIGIVLGVIALGAILYAMSQATVNSNNSGGSGGSASIVCTALYHPDPCPVSP